MTKRLLVIDDEERIREVVRVCLEDLAGWKVTTAESAQAGLSQATTLSFDAILLDVSMPDMDGFTLCRQLQATPVTRSIPIILLTATMLSVRSEELQTLGVVGVIAKPFDPIQICVQVAEILDWEASLTF